MHNGKGGPLAKGSGIEVCRLDAVQCNAQWRGHASMQSSSGIVYARARLATAGSRRPWRRSPATGNMPGDALMHDHDEITRIVRFGSRVVITWKFRIQSTLKTGLMSYVPAWL